MAETEMAECPNCGCVFAYTPEDFWTQIADEVDWQEPGNEVPGAKCPDCGVYAYVLRESAAREQPEFPFYVGWDGREHQVF